MHGLHAYVISVVLLWLACVAYAVLIVLSAVRVCAFRSDVADDLADPGRAFGLFTFVAATSVVGTRLAVDGHYAAAFTLLAVASLAWLILGYVVPWTAVLGKAQRPVLQSANGTWFIWVVASQSIAVLAAMLQPVVGGGQREFALLAVFSWSVGVFLYGAAGLFVAARMLLYPLRPQDLTPPLLGGDGCHRDHRRRRGSHRRDGRRADGRRDSGPDCRNVGAVLGVRHVADPSAGGRRGVAARRPPNSPSL